ncbi:ABC transporter substrate-binding protein [Crossiella sp. CA-258035]|uniref:ABC transporter substrate-binding protein n=1 Tax=Crossiella sp. CA-258035 TaxID=2981138 RepID=UPI0024BC0E7C|nr:ABC transporter substrate-binding protein [Crossiella sp. CA-258035]WHT22599.1 ABC transporter substrate-binding protein [Crossiella sp. CA-258035]
MIGRLTVVLATTLLVFAGMAPVASAAGRPGHCPDGNGVTVIIDFQQLGGSTIVRCAVGEQETGHAALRNAGIRIAGTNRWGEAFVCRIEGKPGPEAEACIDTPPATAYWSYWHAPEGGQWTYSQYGVMNRKPPLGSFEGWSFSKDRTAETNPPPRLAPVRPRQESTRQQPPPPVPPPAQPRPSRTPDAPLTSNASAPPTSAESPSATSETSTPPSSTESSAPPSATSSVAAPTPSWTGGVRAGAEEPDRGIPATTLIGIGVVIALVLGAGTVAWRRRRAESDAG